MQQSLSYNYNVLILDGSLEIFHGNPWNSMECCDRYSKHLVWFVFWWCHRDVISCAFLHFWRCELEAMFWKQQPEPVTTVYKWEVKFHVHYNSPETISMSGMSYSPKLCLFFSPYVRLSVRQSLCNLKHKKHKILQLSNFAEWLYTYWRCAPPGDAGPDM